MTTAAELGVLAHERDGRTDVDRALDVDRILALTPEQLDNLRGVMCRDCGSRDCLLEGCDKGCNRHGVHPIEFNGKTRIVCGKCVGVVNCASCDVERYYWQTTTIDGDIFCAECCHVEPTEIW